MTDDNKLKRQCPHCQGVLESWLPPPETCWNELLVCNNNACTYYLESFNELEEQGGAHRACRYAEEVECDYRPIALVAWIPRQLRSESEDD